MTLRDDLFDALQPALDCPAIWADQNGMRPPLPYAVLRAKSRRMVNRDHYSDVDAAGVQTVKGDREFTLSIQRHGPGGVDALEAFTNKLRTQTIFNGLARAGVAVVEILPVVNISAVLDAVETEERAALDVMLRVRSSLADFVGIIEVVAVAGNDAGGDPATDDQYRITVTLP
ncbi:MAG: phage neck terminator protein [Burkholderiaceae bacterium]